MAVECQHGQLTRQCETCAYEEENAALRARVAELEAEVKAPRACTERCATWRAYELRRSFWKSVARKLRLHKLNYRMNWQRGREDDTRIQAELRRERDEARAEVQELGAEVDVWKEKATDFKRAWQRDLAKGKELTAEATLRAERAERALELLQGIREGEVNRMLNAEARAERAEAEVERFVGRVADAERLLAGTVFDRERAEKAEAEVARSAGKIRDLVGKILALEGRARVAEEERNGRLEAEAEVERLRLALQAAMGHS